MGIPQILLRVDLAETVQTYWLCGLARSFERCRLQPRSAWRYQYVGSITRRNKPDRAPRK